MHNKCFLESIFSVSISICLPCLTLAVVERKKANSFSFITKITSRICESLRMHVYQCIHLCIWTTHDHFDLKQPSSTAANLLKCFSVNYA